MPAKVCVVGADAMDPDVIVAGIDSGKLPNLARLRARAVSGRVINPPRFFSGASWPTFYSGVAPARHDRYLRTLYDPATCVHRPFRPPSGRVEAFWLRDDWRRRKTAVIDIPYYAPRADSNGLHVARWGAHDEHDPRVVPAERTAEVVSRFGSDPVGDCSRYEGTSALIDLRDRLLRRVRAKSDMACHYLDSDTWDLFVTVFDDTHCVGHRFWHLQDSTHDRYDPTVAASLGRPVEDVYAEIDRALGGVVSRLGRESTVFFVSSHGMKAAFDANSVLDEVLRRIEGLPPRAPGFREKRSRRMAAAHGLSELLPSGARAALAPLRRRFGRGQLIERLDEERRRRKCFWLPTHDTWGGIRINLAGRESGGIVRPGEECERFVAGLIEDLHALRDGRSGEPIVGQVLRSAEVDDLGYEGGFPDLIVRWSKASVSSVESAKIGRLKTILIDGRTGDHDPAMNGIFFAAGPGIEPAVLSDPIRLEDFAPTISRLAGIECPRGEGTPIVAIGSRASAA